ncbi:MAG: PKD domain-containing protein [Saprospiraceae bacterium]
MQRLRISTLLSVLLWTAIVFAQTPCTYLVYEAFNYPNGQTLHNLSGGSGWQSPWYIQNEETAVPGYQTGTGSSLSYSNLTTAGNHASGGYEYVTVGRRLNTSPDGSLAAYIADDAIGSQTNGGELWVSVLLQRNTGNLDEVAIDLHNSEIVTCPQCSNDNRISVGFFGDQSVVNGVPRWSLLVNGTVINTNVAAVTGTPAFIVLRLVFGAAATQVDMYVNPASLGNSNPGTPAISHQSTPVQFRSLSFYGGNEPGRGTLDEIRFATSYSCVAPDPSVVINQPPVAVAAVTPSAGDAPLAVSFSAVGSFDPDGDAVTYRWNFGDGSATVEGITANHTYTTGGGQYFPSLTVVDSQGAEGTFYLTVSVTNPGQALPCFSTVVSEALADCSGQGGRIAVHTEPNVSATLRLNGNLIAPAWEGSYQQLQAGVYQLEATGANGCVEQYDIHIRVDSTTCDGWTPDACAMRIGTNLNGFADWVPQRPMKNFLKNTRSTPIPYTDNCDCWSFDDPDAVLAQMQFDENGYPLTMPQNTTEGATRLRFFVSASGANMPADQTYVLLYDGQGILSLNGALSNESTTPGRMQFDLGGDGTFWFQILESTMGNHIRNVRILRLEDEFADLDNDPFYEVFLDRIAPFQNLRFMDWMSTNGNVAVRWEDRKLPDYYTYGGDVGVPYEVIIQLANQLDKDIWICVPHAADDDYIRQMAQLFRDNLKDNIVIYLEYSNEVWNWIFPQAHYNVENNPLGLMYGRAMADKARRVFRIWHEEFSGQTCRVKRVLGLQAGFNYLNDHILAQLQQDEWDYGSPTHYFGLDHGETGNPRLDLLGANATVSDVMANALHHFEEFAPAVRQDYRNVQLYGKEVITYEGGQHFGATYSVFLMITNRPCGMPKTANPCTTCTSSYWIPSARGDVVWLPILVWRVNKRASSVLGAYWIISTWKAYLETAPKYQVHLDNMPAQACVEAARAQDLSCITPNSTEAPTWEDVAPALWVYPNPGQNVIYFREVAA